MKPPSGNSPAPFPQGHALATLQGQAPASPRGRALAGLLAGSLCLSACGGDFKLPGAYRIDIQQGNVIEQYMLLRLKPGMDKSQVRIILGTPILIDPFHTNRWEYIYTLSRGGELRRQRHFTLYFDDDGKLDHVAGDVTPGRDDIRDLGKQNRAVDVPLTKAGKKGFFRNVFGGRSAEPEQTPAADEQGASGGDKEEMALYGETADAAGGDEQGATDNGEEATALYGDAKRAAGDDEEQATSGDEKTIFDKTTPAAKATPTAEETLYSQ